MTTFKETMYLIKTIALSLLLLASSFLSFAQEKLDTSAFKSWPQVSDASISNDGKYVVYLVTKPINISFQLIIKAVNSGWKTNFVLPHRPNTDVITYDSRLAAIITSGDTLRLIHLKTKQTEIVIGVKMLNIQHQGQWIAYSSGALPGRFTFRNSLTNKEVSVDNIANLNLPEKGNCIYYWVNTVCNKKELKHLYVLNLRSCQAKLLWIGSANKSSIVSNDGQQIAFLGRTDSLTEDKIWYYNASSHGKAINLNMESVDLQPSLKLRSVDAFEENDKAISITVQKDTTLPKREYINIPSLDIWSYTDFRLQSEQSNALPTTYLLHSLFRIDTKKYIQTTNADESEVYNFKNQKYTLVLWSDPRSSPNERLAKWNPYNGKQYYLISNENGTRKSLPLTISSIVSLSPHGKYLIFIDTAGYYCSYTIATGAVINLNKNVKVNWGETRSDVSWEKDVPRYIDPSQVFWTPDDKSFFVYDRYDIWQMDAEADKVPVNITGGYGAIHQIQFSWATTPNQTEVKEGQKFILKAFNKRTKESGYFGVVIGNADSPVQLTMGPYKYFCPDHGPWVLGDAPLTKAANTNIYLVGRMSVEESPNYFYTSDFRTFYEISDIYPEKKYHWVTSELVNWKQLDGTNLQGILYKPSNFDPKKKYPLIFCYYEHLSDELNVYRTPGLSMGLLNAPFYTTNGYLVFYPDILKRTGAPGRSACDAVVSAAEYFSKKSYIDSAKIGLYGLSFGSYETNYIITHSKLFACAASICGWTNLVYLSGQLGSIGNTEMKTDQQEYAAFGQQAMGKYIWEFPSEYLEESPIANSDKITTPLLMMYNKNDGANFEHGVGFFVALRTLGKKAWLLQYDEGSHGIDFSKHPSAASDFDIRLMQFYNFYLMGKSAPLWMLDGIPKYLKGTKTGLELDTAGRTPGPGLPQLRAKLDMHK